MLAFTEYTKLFAGLVAIVNPVGQIPIFLSMTEKYTTKEKYTVGLIASASAFGILIFFLFSGELVLRAFGIGIPSFRIAGGLLILLVSLSMMFPREDASLKAEKYGAEPGEKYTIGVVPLAMPLMAGPGAITTVIIYAHRHESVEHYLMIVAAILSVALVSLILFRLSSRIESILGKPGMSIVSRIMGLIMGAIAVEFIAAGILALFPGLN